ncbi:MAG: SEC-C metal-binding domain-containing protein, partial [Pseudomonadales bacterium]
YAQKQPKQEYKREAFELFEQLLNDVKLDVIKTLARIQLQSEEDVVAIERERREEEARSRLKFNHQNANALEEAPAAATGSGNTPFVRRERKVGRNEPCPCGSGKKFKSCHGQL